MYKPMLIFCPKEIAKQFSDRTGIMLLKIDKIKESIDHLNAGNPLIVTESSLLLQGWAAPENTLAVFVEGFPTEGPIRDQAEGRYNRASKESKIPDSFLIRDIPLPTRAKNALHSQGATTVKHLKECSRRYLLMIPNFGKGSLFEIEAFLGEELPEKNVWDQQREDAWNLYREKKGPCPGNRVFK